MNQKLSTIKRISMEAIKRIWIVFSCIFVLAVIVFSILDGDNIFSSDDPYLFGFIFGLVCAGLALVYTIFNNIGKLAKRKHWIVGFCLAIWCLFLVIMEILNHGEGDGLAGFFAGVSLISGVVGWALCMVSFPKVVYATISAFCVFFLIAYVVVAVRLASY